MELNFIRICWNVVILWAHSGTFLNHTANLYLFFPPQNTCFCAFSPAGAPLFEVCLMWPDAENELLFRFQSLPKPHLGAMSHTWLLAVIDLRSGRLWHCWKKKEKKNALHQMWFCCPASIIQWNEFIHHSAGQSGWKGVGLFQGFQAGWRDLNFLNTTQ